MNGFPGFNRLTIRGKMTVAALAPLVPVLLLVALGAFTLINNWIVDEAQRRVTRQLHAAREVLRNEERHLHEVVRLTSRSPELVAALTSGDQPRLAEELAALYRREGLDLLTLTDPAGKVICRGANPQRIGGESAPATLVAALAGATLPGGPLLLSRDELLREGEALTGKARLALLPPLPADRPEIEERGLFLISTVPLIGSDGRRLGYLYGGLLLNNNLALVDRIKEIIYGGESHGGIESGSATLFLDDLRIATTVRLANRERALGTRISREVADAVLVQRRHWVDRALVVDQWYLTAYEPLLDPGDKVVGALYVGLPEQPYTQLKRRAALLLCGLLIFGSGLGFIMARSGAEHLSRPIRELDASARRVADGEREIRLPATTDDEIGHLTETFNRMTCSLAEREDELRRFNRELEDKIEERTALLKEQSLALIQAKEELARSERLAAIGSLAAGVAHEINNPAAIIRGNVELLRREVPAGVADEEVGEILHQIGRISLITQELLTFAREERLALRPLRINPLLEEILAQAGHQVPFGRVVLQTELAAELPELFADREQLRQVFTNLIINALQAMAGEGTLTVQSRLDGEWIEVVVADTGPGIGAEAREKIFHPFFTTKPDGSGLGLSIVYGILRNLGGTIDLESGEGSGARFIVRLQLPGGEAV